jgi:hypothetical protein
MEVGELLSALNGLAIQAETRFIAGPLIMAAISFFKLIASM